MREVPGLVITVSELNITGRETSMEPTPRRNQRKGSCLGILGSHWVKENDRCEGKRSSRASPAPEGAFLLLVTEPN